MSRDRSSDDIVTTFLLNTCRLRPEPRDYAVLAAVICGRIATFRKINGKGGGGFVALITGSVAEFYIEPMLPHVGDIDIMHHQTSQLAIPRGHPPPTQLPPEFHNHIQVVEIIDSDFPGFVYLVVRYLLTENSDDGVYNAAEQDGSNGLVNLAHLECKGVFPGENIHGPAIYFAGNNILSLDLVPCIRCLMWPLQAGDWATRHSNYSWPDSATLDRAVSNGCDVVPVAHRLCRQHEWKRVHQWRLSFSRAEIVLINSWMPVQQIVYHMLRVFIKILPDCAGNSGAGTLSNYHIKTLMLWACELKPRSWWTEDVNLVRMCSQLLHILAEWLTIAECKHYFLNDCNLIDSSFNLSYLTNIRDQLMSIEETWLSTWFVDNYIRKCLQFTPRHISRLFDDVSTGVKLQQAISAVVAWKQNSSRMELCSVFYAAEFWMASAPGDDPLNVRSCVGLMTDLAKVDSRLPVYFTAVAFLHVAFRSLRHGLTDELMDILATVCGQFTDSRRYPYRANSLLSLNKAVKLMKFVANKSISTISLIETELSKAYLYRALRCKDSDSGSIYCLVNVYLAVLYYTTGHCQTAIDHCTLVTRSQDHLQCSSHVVQGDSLPKIDDNIDNALGLAVFYQHVRTAALNEKLQAQHAVAFRTELLAYYLHIKCLSVIMCRHFVHSSSTDEFKRYEICISDTHQLFICDVLLFLSVSRLLESRQKRICPNLQPAVKHSNEYNTSDLVDLLQKSAVEHLTTFRQIEARDFGPVTIVTTDYEALYAYKRGDYQRCLRLSIQNVHTLLHDDDMPDVLTFPDFIQLYDDEIVSLIGLVMICDPTSRDRCNCVGVSQLTLSLYLMTQCQLKLRHSVTSLVRTLECIKGARRRLELDACLNPLVQMLTKRKALAYIREQPIIIMHRIALLFYADLLRLVVKSPQHA